MFNSQAQWRIPRRGEPAVSFMIRRMKGRFFPVTLRYPAWVGKKKALRLLAYNVRRQLEE